MDMVYSNWWGKGIDDLGNRQTLSKVKKKNVCLMGLVDNLAKMAITIGVMGFQEIFQEICNDLQGIALLVICCTSKCIRKSLW